MLPLLNNPSLSTGSRILVTGANGYIASHIIDLLLELGYNVRGTIRSPKPWLDEFFHSRHSTTHYESVTLSNLNDATTLDEIMRDVSGVIHVASDVSLSPDTSVIDKTIKSTQLLLQCAAKHSSIRRVVLTSSSTAALLPQPNKPGIRVTHETYNDLAVSLAYSPTTPPAQKPFLVYAASKTEGERHAWNWVRENDPGFVFNTVLPGTNFGKILHPHIPGSTMSFIRGLQAGNDFAVRAIPPQWFINVQDTARLHITALLDRSVTSERIFGFARPFNWTDVLDVLRESGVKDGVLPAVPENEARDLGEVVPSRRAEELLVRSWGREGWVGLEESVLS
ncbi:cinnamoyl-CoA reductase [Aspergillus sclerotioniger CBS 115572]|uniref:Cinnamoyl-CoA reductase n=1 Tax=Aspergillus sclerotioniger CBS 115572 TaxID=1450535 RepID=A0A317WT66_9EURO|nr:cinnamoyl-CoA reductase [Aspergillus sclerotioniger CBS 115572]PWY88118.1 cinnamoyl-CoA reductase [Aspergillus sclerotioniger CBS 115572]